MELNNTSFLGDGKVVSGDLDGDEEGINGIRPGETAKDVGNDADVGDEDFDSFAGDVIVFIDVS